MAAGRVNERSLSEILGKVSASEQPCLIILNLFIFFFSFRLKSCKESNDMISSGHHTVQKELL